MAEDFSTWSRAEKHTRKQAYRLTCRACCCGHIMKCSGNTEEGGGILAGEIRGFVVIFKQSLEERARTFQREKGCSGRTAMPDWWSEVFQGLECVPGKARK